jgi:hypothetical protein
MLRHGHEGDLHSTEVGSPAPDIDSFNFV